MTAVAERPPLTVNSSYDAGVAVPNSPAELERLWQAAQQNASPVTLGAEAERIQEIMALERAYNHDPMKELGMMGAQGVSSLVLPTASNKASNAALKEIQQKVTEKFGEKAVEAAAQETVEQSAKAVSVEVVAEGSDLALKAAQARNITGKVGSEFVEGVSKKAVNTVGKKAAEAAIETTAEQALSVAVSETAEAGASAATKSMLAEAVPYIGDVAVAGWQLYNAAKTQGEKQEILTGMFVDDLLAKGVIEPNEKPTYDDLRKLVELDPASYSQLGEAIAQTDNWAVPTIAQAGISSAGGFAGSAAAVALGTAAIVGTGGAATPFVVGALSVGGAIGGSVAAGQATKGFFEHENGFEQIQKLEQKLQQGETITAAEVFQVLVADDEALKKDVEAQVNKRRSTAGKTFSDLTEPEQKVVMDQIDEISGASSVLAERINSERLPVKDLLGLSNDVLRRGAEEATLLADAKEIQRNSAIPSSPTIQVEMQPVANENTPAAGGWAAKVGGSRNVEAQQQQSWAARVGGSAGNPAERTWAAQMAAQRELAAQQENYL
jgi:hypothetical protein